MNTIALLILAAAPPPVLPAVLTAEIVAARDGNREADAWQFWFELAHKSGRFQRLDTHSRSVPKGGIAKKVRGPIASLLPNPGDTAGWIFHRDWDGRFEGIWGDLKAKQVIAYPYVEKRSHLSVAITYRVPTGGRYDISGGVTDLQVSPEHKQHDGIEWRIEIVDTGKVVRKVGSGGPVGDGNGRPDGEKFAFRNVAVAKGQLIRLVIDPRRWWGTDMTRIDAFRIAPAKD